MAPCPILCQTSVCTQRVTDPAEHERHPSLHTQIPQQTPTVGVLNSASVMDWAKHVAQTGKPQSRGNWVVEPWACLLNGG